MARKAQKKGFSQLLSGFADEEEELLAVEGALAEEGELVSSLVAKGNKMQ